MTFITSDPIAPYRHALHAWASPLATCALPKGVCYLLTLLTLHAPRRVTSPGVSHPLMEPSSKVTLYGLIVAPGAATRVPRPMPQGRRPHWDG